MMQNINASIMREHCTIAQLGVCMPMRLQGIQGASGNVHSCLPAGQLTSVKAVPKKGRVKSVQHCTAKNTPYVYIKHFCMS